MKVVLAKTAYSPLLGVAITPRGFDGRRDAAARLPIHLGSMPLAVKAAIRLSVFEPGDVFIHNDPYFGEAISRRQRRSCPFTRRRCWASPRAPTAGHQEQYAQLLRHRHRDLRRARLPPVQLARAVQNGRGSHHLHQCAHPGGVDKGERRSAIYVA
jgi:hypothetical protein